MKKLFQSIAKQRRGGAPVVSRFGRRLHLEALETREMFAVVPNGFTESLVADGLTSPTSIATASTGDIFVAQQNGTIRIISDGVLQATPFATLSVDDDGERGLTGITLDPNFATNGFVYVYYTASSPTSHNRLSRLTANGDQMVAGSEVILLDLPALSTVEDPIYHMGGAIHFGPHDGKLYVSVGDHQDPPKAQSLNNLFGKILRLNSDGTIPADNPFFNTATGVNRAIYAYGLRNPFTTAFQPETGLFYINDVGQADWEEINEGTAGGNYGWPSTEGDFDPEDFPNYQRPIYTYDHDGGCSIVGAVFYPQDSPQFPGQYEGMYFFQDFCAGWIKYFDPANPSVIQTFASGIDFPIDLTLDSEGSMYYLSRGDETGGQAPGEGKLFKIAFTAGVAPQVTDSPEDTLVSVGYAATFSASATGSSPLSYQWQKSEAGSGVWANIPNATTSTYQLASTTVADNGDQYRVVVTNNIGSATSAAATLSVTTNQPPIATITLPTAGTKYNAGDTLTFSGTATDNEDGALPASAYTWQVEFHHDEHSHPFYPQTSGITSDSFTIPTIGHTESNVWYRIHLSVIDSIGLKTSTFLDVLPNKADLTITANIPGVQIVLDGQPKSAPHTAEAVVGVQRSISAPSTVTIGNQSYRFAGWSDGGSQTHLITMPSTDATYTANYVPVAVTYLSDLPFVGTPTNGWGVVERDHSNGEDAANDGIPISIRGTTYTKGLGVHATSQVTFNLAGQYTTFLSDIGIDDETGGDGSVIFQVFSDNNLVYESGTLLGTSPVQSVELNVTGVNQLRLVVSGGTDGVDFDHADWANARLLSVPPEPPAAPSGLTQTVISGAEIRLNWTDNANNETGFQIERSANGTSGWTLVGTVGSNVTAFNNTGLSPSTTYHYRVRAANGGGTSAYSNVVQATTSAQTITFLSDLPFVGTPTNGWGPVERDRSNGEQGATDGGPIRIRGNTYTKGLGVHSTSVVTFNLAGAYTTFLSDIGIDDETNGSGTVVFQVVADGVTIFTSGTIAGTSAVQSISLNVTGVSQLQLRVNASTNGTTFDHADWANARLLSSPPTPPAAPSGLVATPLSATQIRLDWVDNADNETGFQIERSANGTTGWTQVGTASANANTFTNTGLTAATTYFYRVRAVNVSITSAYTDVADGTTAVAPPAAPSGLSASALSSTEIRITWTDNSANETGFQIDRSPNGTSGWTQIDTVGANVTTYTNTGLTPSTQYFYRVRSANAGGVSANSGVANATTPITAPAAPSGLTTTPLSTTQIRLNWTDNANNESGFQIDRSANGTTGWTQIATVGANVVTYTNTGLTAGTTYFYRVRANNAGGTSANTDVVSGTTLPSPPAAPSSLAASALSSTEIQLTWNDNSANETGFQIDRSANGTSGWTQIGTTGANVNTFNDPGRSPSTQYFYRVRATNTGGNSGNSNVANATTLATPPTPPTAPSNLVATALGGAEIQLTWTDNANNESGFQIERSPDGTNSWTQVGTVGSNVTTFTNVGLAQSTTYYYRVRANNAGGTSAYTGVADATTSNQSVTYLSDLPFVGTPQNGWGPVERDRSNGETGATDGVAMKIRGQTYAKGLGVHATSVVTFNLAGGYTTFLSDIGIDDETNGLGSVQFQVVADGVTIFTSGTLTGTSAVQSISLNVTGVNTLVLRVNVATNNKNDDHADWANARLIAAAPPAPLALFGAPPAGAGSTLASSNGSENRAAEEPMQTVNPQAVPIANLMAVIRKTTRKPQSDSNEAKAASAATTADMRVQDGLLSLLAKDLIQKLKKDL